LYGSPSNAAVACEHGQTLPWRTVEQYIDKCLIDITQKIMYQTY